MIAASTLLDGDWELVGNKTGATRLGFALMLKFFEQEARFPRHSGRGGGAADPDPLITAADGAGFDETTRSAPGREQEVRARRSTPPSTWALAAWNRCARPGSSPPPYVTNQRRRLQRASRPLVTRRRARRE